MFDKIAQNWITQKRNIAFLRITKFANDCDKCYFFAQNCSTTKTKIWGLFRKNCAKVLRMETLILAMETLTMAQQHNFRERVILHNIRKNGRLKNMMQRHYLGFRISRFKIFMFFKNKKKLDIHPHISFKCCLVF